MLFGSDARGKRSQSDADREIVAFLIARGDGARDGRDWQRAAFWYEEALRLMPQRADIHVRHGQMLKEAGEFAAAENAYLAAQALMPDDAEIFLQLGQLYTLATRTNDARGAYERALSLKPEWDVPKRALKTLADAARQQAAPPATMDVLPPDADMALREAASALAHPGEAGRLVPALAPRKPGQLLQQFGEGLEMRQMGRHERGFWGMRRTVRGAEAMRGFCVSSLPIDEVQMLIDGVLFYRGPVRGPYPLKYESRVDGPQKYVFNVWHDFAEFQLGQHAFELRVIDVEGEKRSFHDTIVVGPPLAEKDLPDSDALVAVRDPDPQSLERRIRGRASMARAAKRDFLPRIPNNILVLRTDQLGDMVASVPAMRRLRALFPNARIVGLLTGANAELAATLGLFDEIIVIDFPDDSFERRRIMTLEAQEKLRRQLEPYKFDLAIDLAQAGVSRELLLLSGAPFLYGVEGRDFHWLSADFALNTRDPQDRLDNTPHSRKTLALVETLGAIACDNFTVMRRADLQRDRLEPFGIGPNERYIVLHMGARVAFSRWPGFAELAKLLLERTDLKIVMMTEDPDARAGLPPELLASTRFQMLDQRLAFDDFDTFVSFATVLVGNDSGPKHLASLRGTNTVTLHTARINWNTWGQEGVGTIISRRVPCAGCDIFHDGEECGKDFACIRDIRATEVFDAVSAYV